MKKERYLQLLNRDFTIYENLHDVLSKTHCLIYDVELDSLYASAKNMYDILKLAKERFLRKDSINISKSVCEYMQKIKDLEDYPYSLYTFLHRNVKICIIQKKKRFHVFAIGADFFNVFQKDFYQPDLYGDFDNLSDCIELYDEFVRWFCCKSAGALL